MNVAEILRGHAQRWPDQVALADVYRGRARTTTFGQLDEAAGRLAALLRQAGLAPGDTVLVFQRMSTELYVALAAILRLGLTAMFVDPSAGREYIARCCRMSRPRGLVASSRAHLLRLTTPALREIPLKFSIGGRVPLAVGVERAVRLKCDGGIHACRHDTPALTSFTSGTTGRPKLVLRTHGFLLAQHRAIAAALALVPGEVEMIALPIFVLANLASRLTSVIPDADLRRPDAIDPAPLVAQIARHGVSRAAASPAMFERIVEFCERKGELLPTLGKVFTGGGPVSTRLLDRLQRVAPQARIAAVYGSTEAEPISSVALGEIDLADRAATRGGQGLLAGRPVPSVELRILRDCWGTRIGPTSVREFERLCQPATQPGEVVVSGEHVLAGYLDGRGDEENTLRVDGTCWHRTGDAGYLDARGRLWFLGRCAARLDDERGAVYPLGVEQAALEHKAIRRTALVSLGGRRVLAVELADRSAKLDTAALLKSLSFARLDAVRVLKRVPVDDRHNAKIDYPALHAVLGAPPMTTNADDKLLETAQRRRSLGWLPARWGVYLADRFPPFGYGLLIFSFYSSNQFLAHALTAPGEPMRYDPSSLIGSLTVLGVFLHLRIFDDHKDYVEDCIHFPNRALQRGVVTLGDLKSLLALVVEAELLLSALRGPAAFVSVLLVMGFSLLMLKEFFAREWLRRRFLLYASTHMLILPLLAIAVFSFATGRYAWQAPPWYWLYSFVGFCVAFNWEVSRKIRAPEDEIEGVDTYTKRFGTYRAAYLVLAIRVVDTALMTLVGMHLGLSAWFYAWLALLFAVCSIGFFQYRLRTSPATARRMQTYAGLYIVAFDLALAIELGRTNGLTFTWSL